MLTLKKTAVAVLALGSSAVFAGSMGPVCTPGMVTVPCARTAWDFGAQALYLDAGTSIGDYIGHVVNSDSSSTAVKPSNTWSWGFEIEGSYHFNTGNDVNLNWYHIDHSKNVLRTLGAGQEFAPIWYGSTTNTGRLISGVSANVSHQWDAVNLEFGQHVDFGEFVNTRFHGGLSYLHLLRNETIQGTPVAPTTIPTQRLNSNLSYNGVGARLGADNFYDWNNGFAVYAKGEMALYAGQSKTTANASTPYVTFIPGLTSTFPVGQFSGSTTKVVPELGAKLGGTYTYAMAQGDLSFDVGWMWINYFNAIDNTINAYDFNLQGVYFGAKWVGNVA